MGDRAALEPAALWTGARVGVRGVSTVVAIHLRRAAGFRMPLGVPHWLDARPGRAGIVHPDWECQVVDELGEKLPAGVPGQMFFRPRQPNISQLGYWRDLEASPVLRKNMWFQSGDILVEDEDGWFTFVDRQKDAIRRSVENVSSFEVELVLQGHPTVAEVAVYGLPADVGEDEIAAASCSPTTLRAPSRTRSTTPRSTCPTSPCPATCSSWPSCRRRRLRRCARTSYTARASTSARSTPDRAAAERSPNATEPHRQEGQGVQPDLDAPAAHAAVEFLRRRVDVPG